jgi:carboxymethylenebutenolidase
MLSMPRSQTEIPDSHRRLATALGAIALALLVISCGGAGNGDHTATAQGSSHDTGLTGAVSEDEFKALHELTTEQAPPAKGTTIDLAGSQAYLSLPEDSEPPYPGIVVIHEWWGLNDNIRHWSDRLAAEGYAALAVDLYRGQVADNPDDAMKYMEAVDDAHAIEVMQAGLEFLAKDPRVRASRRASIGWCFGGGMSLKLALNAPDLDAAIIYYGRLTTDPEELKTVKAKLLGIFGNQDKGIPPEMVDGFVAGLEKAGVAHEIHRFDANHAFANPSSARYDQESAAAAWDKSRAFLQANLQGESKEESSAGGW